MKKIAKMTRGKVYLITSPTGRRETQAVYVGRLKLEGGQKHLVFKVEK